MSPSELEWCAEASSEVGDIEWRVCESIPEVLDPALRSGLNASMALDIRFEPGCYFLSMQLFRNLARDDGTTARFAISNRAVKQSYVGRADACGTTGAGPLRDDERLIVETARRAVAVAHAHSSELRDDVASTPGRSGTALRHLLCELGGSRDVRYLEVGVLRGATLFAATNGRHVKAVGIDNWSQFREDDGRRYAAERLPLYAPGATLLDRDSWHPDTPAEALANGGGAPFNVFFYDGGHSLADHYRALPHFLDTLDDVFIFIVDDFEVPHVASSTFASIQHAGLRIVWHHAIFAPLPFPCSDDPDYARAPIAAFHDQWKFGLGMFVLSKKTNSSSLLPRRQNVGICRAPPCQVPGGHALSRIL